MPRRSLPFVLTIAALSASTASLVVVARQAAAPAIRPGPLGGGVTQLPNGWKIAPAGRHAQIGDLPLNMAWTPDGRYLVVTNNGWASPTLTLFDTLNFQVKATVPVNHAWLGLAWHPDGTRLFSSGAAENVVYEFAWNGDVLGRPTPIRISRPVLRPTIDALKGSGFLGGLAISPDGKRLFVVHVLGAALSMVDLERRTVVKTVDLPAEPYSAVVAADGRSVFVSLWGGSRVVVLDTDTLRVTNELAVGEHPNALVLSKDGRRLFVACANTNAVWTVDLQWMRATEQIGVALFPDAPPGSTPNALALAPDGRTLLVANADNNMVAVVDVAEDRSRVEGFIPTGWYPTGVAYDGAGKNIYVLSGKGLSSAANPRGPSAAGLGAAGQYIGQLLQGTLSQVPLPDAATLRAWTERVYQLSAYQDATRLAPANPPVASPIPRQVGEPSPIKHVFYIIRENRTYDQVLGDLPIGNGDPTLTLFGEEVTPNAHALAREFVLLDNFYVDAEVSYDGHAFSTGAYATDVVEKLWPTNYGRRGAIYLSEGGGPDRNEYGNLAAPPGGYLWDAAKRVGVTVRSYGEFAYLDAAKRAVATVPGLKGFVCPDYAPFDLAIPDNRRVDVWIREFTAMASAGTLPRLSILRLGNDHTSGTRPDAPTPRAMVAENDVAIGRVVETIASSPIWRESAIFILEDDAQNGPDHVDAHRSVALVVSPFARRRVLDSTMYSTSSVLRTIELILGIPPMTQYDAAARPMYEAFQPTADAAPFKALPARVPVDERNSRTAWGAAASLRMRLDEADLAPELELNEIVWRSVRGAASPMPPPRHAAFVRAVGEEDEHEKR
jgi:YVTN family beta-propeller protein